MSYSFSATMVTPKKAKSEFGKAGGLDNMPSSIKKTVDDMLDKLDNDGVKTLDVAVHGHHPAEGERGPGTSAQAHITITVLE